MLKISRIFVDIVLDLLEVCNLNGNCGKNRRLSLEADTYINTCPGKCQA